MNSSFNQYEELQVVNSYWEMGTSYIRLANFKHSEHMYISNIYMCIYTVYYQ